MLSEETTIGIYPDGELNNILIVPDGQEYHLFLAGTHSNYTMGNQASNLGSIFVINDIWSYEGDKLSYQSQTEIANYILSYPGPSFDPSASV
ncbi:hypothetical protein [Mucilaginibacter paludis]|uniref:Uncharacterized protein n=1 Tax=Mucilaginibacter paludis DSM 18603 TaxID=714943 RepID=H1YB47_9SPHI|nr:hypothetical protein [Mucilaginibacter paludis]EHQ30573.1 hypothetical protein Mucpa_6520 [Mucilaginibacter paludis DSM 18603]